MVYRLILSYRGTAYAGWQRQRNAPTVQQSVEEALADLLGSSPRLIGASRTDAGVHARGQAAHLETVGEFPLGGLVHGINQRLRQDIRVMSAARMAPGFHARRCAAAKEYRYRVVRATVLSPLDALFAVAVSQNLDLEAMRRATGAIVGDHDFSAFSISGGSHTSPRRRIFTAEWLESGPEMVFRVVGSGFLRGMVRRLVGTLLEVGSGRRAPDGMGDLLAGGSGGTAGPTAPAHALVLEQVLYPSSWRPLAEEGQLPKTSGATGSLDA